MLLAKKSLPFLTGKKIYLRQFVKKDITHKYLKWINFKKNNFFFRDR